MIADIVRLAAEVMEAYSVVLFLLQEDRLEVAAAATLSRHLRRDCVLSRGEGLVGWIHREGKPVVAHDFHRDTRTLQFYDADETIKSFLGMPLAGSRGVLCIDSKKNYRFTDRRVKLAAMLAALIDKELERREVAAVNDERRQRCEFLAAVQRVLVDALAPGPGSSNGGRLTGSAAGTDPLRTVLGLAARRFDCSLVGIATEGGGRLLDGHAWSRTPPLEGGLIGLVVKNGVKLFLNDRPDLLLFTDGPRVDNFCGAPLAGRTGKGCFFLVKREGAWQPAEAALVEETAGLLNRLF